MYIVSSVTSIGDYAFCGSNNITDINFNGTKKQWENIEKGIKWDDYVYDYTIHCTDGDIKK